MHAFEIDPASSAFQPSEAIGAFITHEVRVPGGGRLRKGQEVTAADVDLIARLDRRIHAVRIEPNEVHEDEAARRLAAMMMGPGLAARNPVQSRVNIIATGKGLLRVDAEAVYEVNRHAPVGVFTVLDRLPVVPGKIVAGAKIATIAVNGQVLDDVQEYLERRPQRMLELKPYLPHIVGVVVTEGLAENVRARFELAVRSKMAWYGSSILRFDYVANEPEAVISAIDRVLADGANLVLTAGGNMMDPLDASIVAMPEIGATVTRLGAPAHPGSMFWIGDIAESSTPIVNLASCSMYSRSTVADLVLPWVMSGETVTADDLASIGYGGLLDRDMGWRFPNYELESVVESDEE